MRPTCSVFLVLALLLDSSTACAICFGPPKQVYVGDTSSDGDCTYNDIQSALNAEGGTCPAVVNITREHTYTNEALTISGKSLTLKGWGDGVTCNLLKNCTTAGCLPAETGAPLITLSGASGNSVLHIDGSSGVSLVDLTITGGILNPQQGGGGVYFGGSGSLSLLNTTVSYNQAGFGAGIAMSPSGTATLTLNSNTVIQYNDATVNGGGLLVEGTTTFVATAPNIWIQGNTALSGDGGGIIVNAPAVANIGSPGYFGLPMIYNNSAEYGGGIAAEGFQGNGLGLVRLYTTDPNNPIAVSANVASHTGGGIYLKPIAGDTQNQSFVCAYDFRIDGNTAQEGAAIYADYDGEADGGNVFLNLDPNSDTDGICGKASAPGIVGCASGVACNELNGNIAQTTDGTATDGGAILIQSGGGFYGYRFSMRDNQGGKLIRFLTDHDGGGPYLPSGYHMQDCLLADNTVSGNLIEATPGGGADEVISMDSCTIANNQIGAPFVMFAQMGSAQNSTVTLTNSIFAQPSRSTLDYQGLSGALATHYVLSNDTGTLVHDGTIAQGAPTFVDAANGDYHLQRSSLGVNFAPAGTASTDLDGKARVVNLPGVADFLGPMDLGAYEIQSACAMSDTIFCDGFDGN